jgi:signal transduction histidine kinase
LVQERIAGDVLSLARIQLDMLSLHAIETDLRKEAKKVIGVFASEAKMKKIDLVLDFGETIDMSKITTIDTDPVRLGQVVTNLISNAIRFTATSGRSDAKTSRRLAGCADRSDVRKITVRYDVSFLPPSDDTCALPSSIGLPADLPVKQDTPLWLFVSVRDTGPGLGPKELAMLFKRFSRTCDVHQPLTWLTSEQRATR